MQSVSSTTVCPSATNPATDNAIALIRAAVASLAQQAPEDCPCRNALKLAIWSNKGAVDPHVARRLGPLVERYFRRGD